MEDMLRKRQGEGEGDQDAGQACAKPQGQGGLPEKLACERRCEGQEGRRQEAP